MKPLLFLSLTSCVFSDCTHPLRPWAQTHRGHKVLFSSCFLLKVNLLKVGVVNYVYGKYWI